MPAKRRGRGPPQMSPPSHNGGRASDLCYFNLTVVCKRKHALTAQAYIAGCMRNVALLDHIEQMQSQPEEKRERVPRRKPRSSSASSTEDTGSSTETSCSSSRSFHEKSSIRVLKFHGIPKDKALQVPRKTTVDITTVNLPTPKEQRVPRRKKRGELTKGVADDGFGESMSKKAIEKKILQNKLDISEAERQGALEWQEVLSKKRKFALKRLEANEFVEHTTDLSKLSGVHVKTAHRNKEGYIDVGNTKAFAVKATKIAKSYQEQYAPGPDISPNEIEQIKSDVVRTRSLCYDQLITAPTCVPSLHVQQHAARSGFKVPEPPQRPKQPTCRSCNLPKREDHSECGSCGE